MLSPSMTVTNLSKEQILEAKRDLERSIEANREQISLFQILLQRLSRTSVTSKGGGDLPMAADFLLREKDEVRRVLQGMIQREYDQINGKQDVAAFLDRLLPYAT